MTGRGRRLIQPRTIRYRARGQESARRSNEWPLALVVRGRRDRQRGIVVRRRISGQSSKMRPMRLTCARADRAKPMKAVVCEKWGDPAEVLQVRDVPTPEPSRGQVRVRMLVSPINPSDLLMVRGTYGRQPPLPATPGFEGVGVVEAGSGLLAAAHEPARRRAQRRRRQLGGTGRRAGAPGVAGAVGPDRRAGGDVLRQSGQRPGDDALRAGGAARSVAACRRRRAAPWAAWSSAWAGSSASARINVVRRREQAEELTREGADAVVATGEESLAERVPRLTEGARRPLRHRRGRRADGERGRRRPGDGRPHGWFTARCRTSR